MKVYINVQRMHHTEIQVEASSIQEARTKLMRGDYDDIIQHQERKQNNVYDVNAQFISDVQTIELPESFFPCHMVEITFNDEESYPVTIFGFDGNTVYEANTNIYELRDNADKDYLREIGQYLCNNYKTI